MSLHMRIETMNPRFFPHFLLQVFPGLAQFLGWLLLLLKGQCEFELGGGITNCIGDFTSSIPAPVSLMTPGSIAVSSALLLMTTSRLTDWMQCLLKADGINYTVY